MRNFRSRTSFLSPSLGKLQLLSKLENPTANQAQSVEGPLRWVSQIGPWSRPFLTGLYAFFENRKGFAKNWQTIVDYDLKIWELFLKSPRFPAPRTFLGNRLKIEICTDACARPPYEMASINWESGIGIDGILVVNDIVAEFPSLEVNEPPPPLPRLKGLNSPRRLISFFELLGTYIAVRLWTPSRHGNKDLICLASPIVTGNLGMISFVEIIAWRLDRRLGCCRNWRPIV